MKARGKFQFSNPGAQRAEAMLNAAEARALLARLVPPAAAPQSEPAPSTTAAGSCFRKVVALLEGRK